MRDYDKELSNTITTLEETVNQHETVKGLNLLNELACDYGFINDPKYTEAIRKIMMENINHTELMYQLKAKIWQKNDIIEQIRSTRIGKYLLTKCKARQTF